MKHLCRSQFLLRFQDLRLVHFYLKRDSNTGIFSVDIAKFLRAAFLQKTCSLYLSEILFEFYLVLFYYCKLHLYKEAGLETQLFASSYV